MTWSKRGLDSVLGTVRGSIAAEIREEGNNLEGKLTWEQVQSYSL